MSKKRTKQDRIKLPKHLLGIDLPKDARRRINDLLESLPEAGTRAAVDEAVAGLLAALAARLEAPQHDVVQMFPSREIRLRGRSDEAGSTAH